MNEDNITGWFTTDNVTHVPIHDDETKGQALRNRFDTYEKNVEFESLGSDERRSMLYENSDKIESINNRLEKYSSNLEDELEDKGYTVSYEQSRQSEAYYITLYGDGENYGNDLSIRVGDHSHDMYSYGNADLDYRYDEFKDTNELMNKIHSDIQERLKMEIK